MKTMIIAGLVITFPATLLLFYYVGTDPKIAMAAGASLALNSIPFLVGGMLLRKGDGSDADSH